MVLYWLVSIPYGNADMSQVKSKFYSRLKREGVQFFDFEVPQLKVGTQDSLYTLVDESQRYDNVLENITMKISKNLRDISEISDDDYRPKIILGDDQAIDLKTYFTHFQWDDKKHSMKNKDLLAIAEGIYKQSMKMDDDLKVKLLEYATLRSNLAQIDRRDTGNLLIRPLDGLIKPEELVDTENLTTVFVVLTKENVKHFLQHYETYGEQPDLPAAVPDSYKVLKEDGDMILASVVVLKKLHQDFKTALEKDKKAKIREFVYNEERAKLSEMEKKKLEETKNEMRNSLINLCTSDFSETFISWMHLKCVRVFAESVLRYGVPPNFFVVLIKVEGHERRMHKVLKDETHVQGDEDDAMYDKDDGAGGSDFYSYVLIPNNTSDFKL